jgi:putative endonuclease
VRRIYEHRTGVVPGFTKRYRVHRLVYYEQFSDVEYAIQREKRLKKWNRTWRIRLIEELNPNWMICFPRLRSLDFLACHARESGHPVTTVAPVAPAAVTRSPACAGDCCSLERLDLS